MRRFTWLLVSSGLYAPELYVSADVSVLSFSRKLDTCDSADNPILLGTQRVLYAYNDEAPANNNPDAVQYHGPNRGAKSLNLMSNESDVLPPLEPDAFSWDLRMIPTSVPRDSTIYYCTAYALPRFEQPIHIVRWEPIITRGNEDVVHHVLIYECETLSDADLRYRGSCHTGNMPPSLSRCNFGTPLAIWAVGGSTFDYPKHVGMPLGRPDSPRFALMEIHFDNPTRRVVTDDSGVRFWSTPTLREIDGGVLVTGMNTNPQFLIPPGRANHEEYAWCPGVCTRSLFPAGGITIFASMLHAHLLGRRIRLSHSRQGVELPDIIDDRGYDFDFQDAHRLPEPVQVLPGDQLGTRCFYDSRGRTTNTRFGIATTDEMCLTYNMYYPRIQGRPSVCVSGNFTRTNLPRGLQVTCGGVPITSGPEPITRPLPETPCTYVPPDGTRPIWNETYDINDYVRHEVLDRDGKIRLHWRVEEQNIHFLVEADTKGWFAIGLSPNGGMDGSDVLMGWLDATSRQVFVHDRFAAAKIRPPRDALQDLFNIQGAVIFSELQV